MPDNHRQDNKDSTHWFDTAKLAKLLLEHTADLFIASKNSLLHTIQRGYVGDSVLPRVAERPFENRKCETVNSKRERECVLVLSPLSPSFVAWTIFIHVSLVGP